MQDSNATGRGGARTGAGRPHATRTSLAAAMRERFPVERIVDLAEQLVTGAESDDTKLRTLLLIVERAHGKVTDRHEIVARTATDEDTFAELSADELRAAIAERRALLIDAEHRLSKPTSTDDDAPAAHLLTTGSEIP